MSKQCLEPLEVETLGGARSFDLADDATFDMVIRMAWTGIIHVHGGSPPHVLTTRARECSQMAPVQFAHQATCRDMN